MDSFNRYQLFPRVVYFKNLDLVLTLIQCHKRRQQLCPSLRSLKICQFDIKIRLVGPSEIELGLPFRDQPKSMLGDVIGTTIRIRENSFLCAFFCDNDVEVWMMFSCSPRHQEARLWVRCSHQSTSAARKIGQGYRLIRSIALLCLSSATWEWEPVKC